MNLLPNLESKNYKKVFCLKFPRQAAKWACPACIVWIHVCCSVLVFSECVWKACEMCVSMHVIRTYLLACLESRKTCVLLMASATSSFLAASCSLMAFREHRWTQCLVRWIYLQQPFQSFTLTFYFTLNSFSQRCIKYKQLQPSQH